MKIRTFKWKQNFLNLPLYYTLFFCGLTALAYTMGVMLDGGKIAGLSVSPSVFTAQAVFLSFFIIFAYSILKNPKQAVISLALASIFIVFVCLRSASAWYLLCIPIYAAAYFVFYRFGLEEESIKIKLSNRIDEMNARRIALQTDFSKKKQHIDGTEKRLNRYLELINMMESLTSVLPVQQISDIILDKIFNLISESNRIVMYLIDKERQNIYPINFKKRKFKVKYGSSKGDVYDFWVLQHEKALIVQDTDNDFRFTVQESGKVEGVRSILAVPIISEAKTIGLLRVDHFEPGAFVQDDLRLLDIIASLSAVALQNALLYERMNELSKKDGLTNLFLRRYFESALEKEFALAKKNQLELACMMIDIDYFKKYNDRFGHVAGDALLKGVGEIIRSFTGKIDVACRYGGEEFACVIKGKSFDDVLKLAEKMRKTIEGHVFKLRRQDTSATVSIGLSRYSDGMTTSKELLMQADKNLYKAKDGGRNQVCA